MIIKSRFTLAIMMYCLLFAFDVQGQVFHFQNTSALITKTTAQSPAHWYIEIFNDAGIDTILRWKADVSGVPAAWDITLDDQNNFYTYVHTGDSADFTLYDSLSLPQKLIIGAWTKNTPGMGSIYFDIYDPANLAGKVTIEYIFIITQAVGIQMPEAPATAIKIEGTQIIFSLAEMSNYCMISASGQLVHSAKIKTGCFNFSNFEPGVYFIYYTENKKTYIKKIIR